MIELPTDVVEGVINNMNREMDEELKDAYLKGYDYAHVFSDISSDIEHSINFKRKICKSSSKIPPDVDGYEYEYTYIIDDEIIEEYTDLEK